MEESPLEAEGKVEEEEASPGRLRVFLAGHWREILIFLFFFGLASFLTWPLLIRFNTSIYGWPSDNLAYVSYMWWLKHAHALGGNPGFSPLIGFPFGTHYYSIGTEYISDFITRGLLVFFNEVVAYNIRLFLSFLISGVTMYYLVRHLTRDRRAAFLGGTAFLVCTYHAYHAMSIPGLAFTQWMPLFILALLLFVEKRSWKWAILAALSWLLVVGTSIHYGFFMAIFMPSFLVGRYAYLKYRQSRDNRTLDERVSLRPKIDRHMLLKSVAAILLAMVIAVPIPLYVLSNTYTAGKWPTSITPGQARADYNADWGAAPVSDYFKPSDANPIFGSFFGNRLAYLDSVYLGWTLIILALAGLVLALIPTFRRKRGPPGEIEVSEPNPVSEKMKPWKPYMAGFVLAAVVAFILSLQTHVRIGPLRIPMPSLLFRYIPWFRWYMRLAIVAIICVIALACYGLTALFKFLEKRDKKYLAAAGVLAAVAALEYTIATQIHSPLRWVIAGLVLIGTGLIVYLLYGIGSMLSEKNREPLWPYVLTFTASVLLILEMLIVPPFKNFDFAHEPDLYRYLKTQKNSSYVIYPAYETGYFKTSQYLFNQRYYAKPILNGALDNSDGEAVRRTVYNPYDPGVPSYLARFGIKDVLYLDAMFAGYEGHDTADRLVQKLPPGLTKQARFTDPVDNLMGNGYVLQVTAPAAEIVPIFQGDISVPHIDVGLLTVRLAGQHNDIRLVNYAKAERLVSVEVPLTNLGGDHSFKVTAGSQVLSSFDLKDSKSTVLQLDVKVPAGGTVIHLDVKGELAVLAAGEQQLYGIGSATASMGAVKVEVVH